MEALKVLDTDVFIDHFRGLAAATAYIQGLPVAQRATTDITIMELYQGAANYCAERIHLQKKRPGVNRAYTPGSTDEPGSSPAVTPLAAASPVATTAAATLRALLLRPGFIHD